MTAATEPAAATAGEAAKSSAPQDAADKIAERRLRPNRGAAPGHSPASTCGAVDELGAAVAAMLRYATRTGRRAPPSTIAAVAAWQAGALRDPVEAARRLSSAYDRLAEAVAPATPAGILALDQGGRGDATSFFGPVRIVRCMLAIAIGAVATFIAVGFSPLINDMSATSTIFDLSGAQLLLVQLFRLSAAAIGASFAALYQANRQIVEGSWRPEAEASYVIRFVLGLISGLILAELAPIEGPKAGLELTKPLLALLGGFSAVVVHRVLERLVMTIETLVQGDARDAAAAREQTLRARSAEREARARFDAAARLLPIQQALAEGAPSDATRARLAAIVDDLLDGGGAGAGRVGDREQDRS